MSGTKKIVITSLCSVAAVLIVVVGIVLFVLNRGISVAQKPLVIEDEKNNVYLMADATGYTQYRFKIRNNDETFYIESEVNRVDFSKDEHFNVGESYYISVCYKGEIDGNRSTFSDETFYLARAYLDSPVLKIENDTLSWTQVPNATSYVIQAENFSKEIEGESISLQSFPSGVQTISVRAKNDKDKKTDENGEAVSIYKTSAPATITHTIVHHFQKFERINYSKSDGRLTIYGFVEEGQKDNRLSKIDIFIRTGDQTEQYTLEVQRESYLYDGDDKIQYIFYIKPLYRSGCTIGATPTNIDSYNTFSSVEGNIVWWSETI